MGVRTPQIIFLYLLGGAHPPNLFEGVGEGNSPSPNPFWEQAVIFGQNAYTVVPQYSVDFGISWYLLYIKIYVLSRFTYNTKKNTGISKRKFLIIELITSYTK